MWQYLVTLVILSGETSLAFYPYGMYGLPSVRKYTIIDFQKLMQLDIIGTKRAVLDMMKTTLWLLKDRTVKITWRAQ